MQWLARASAFVLVALLSVAAADDAVRPVYGEWGFDLNAMSRDTKPGDDFFRYADGAWIDRATIPADKSAVTRRLEMTDRTEARLHELLESTAAKASARPADLSGKIGAFYKSFMDESRIEKLGAGAIARNLNAVRAAQSPAAIAALMGTANRDFVATSYTVGIDIDLKHPDRYAVYLTQGGLGLPDRDYYLENSFAAKKAAYQTYVEKLLGLIRWPESTLRAKEVVDLETEIARVSWTKAQQRDVNATYNPVSLADLRALAPGFDWKSFLDSAGITGQPLIVAEKSAFPKIASILARAPLTTVQAWEAFHIADNAAPYLSSAFAQAWFEMHDKVLAGQQEQRARWKRAITAVSGGDFGVGDRFGTFGTMGFGVGELYAAQYFPPESKAKVQELVRNVMAAYRARLRRLDWMSEATRAEAIRKLDTYTVKIGYPDHPRDYAALDVASDDLTGNVRRAAAFDWRFYLHRSLGPVDKGSWDMTPQTNDAYNGSLRDIVFPAGILQPPIFDADADPAVNYGAVGAVIGHELTHGFDDEGRKIDAAGGLRDWWAPSDAAAFTARAAMLGEQYSSFRPLPNDPSVKINGKLTMGENIADLGGLTLALDAYRLSLGAAPDRTIDGFTGAQRVFLGWAQAWCGKTRDDAIRKQVVGDPHSPRQFRVNGVVRNIDAWYAAFEVQPGNALYVPPDERVRIW
jgi:putative endopeptidase